MSCFRDSSHPVGKPVGLVTAPYVGHTPEKGAGLWSRMEALGISTDFFAGVLTARKLEGGIRFGLGSTLATTKEALAEAGGLRSLVEYLADEVGWSRKRLWSRFRAQVGLTPKQAAKLIRFDHAVRRLAAGHSAASTAADGGFVDQSHLCRDVKDFTGLTPATVAHASWLAVDDVAWPTRIVPRGTFLQDRRSCRDDAIRRERI